MGWQEEARRKAAAGQGGFRKGPAGLPLPKGLAGAHLVGGPESQPPRDRFGKPLQVGDLVLYRPTFDLVFQVVALGRSSQLGGKDDPIPPGDPTIMVLEIQVPMQVPTNGMPMMNVVTIGHMAPAQQVPGGDPNMPATDQGGGVEVEGGPSGGRSDAEGGTEGGMEGQGGVGGPGDGSPGFDPGPEPDPAASVASTAASTVPGPADLGPGVVRPETLI
jgi:hypothetical protein